MKVALLTPWDNAWVPYFAHAFRNRGCKFTTSATTVNAGEADIVLHGWAAGHTQPVEGARNIFFLRRYELFDGGLGRIDWSKADALILVNSWIRERVQEYFAFKKIRVPTHLIYNGTDAESWTFKRRAHGSRIGMACHVHPKKNLPLALQILARLPEDYTLHIAGEVQDPCMAEYLNHLARRMRRKVYIYGHVQHDQLDVWWEQMNYCLSTSISEGNPNNVIEAMAKGIKPVIHDWPGADDQFEAVNRFVDLSQAAAQFDPVSRYDSSFYRAQVGEKFSLKNIERAVDIALNVGEVRCT